MLKLGIHTYFEGLFQTMLSYFVAIEFSNTLINLHSCLSPCHQREFICVLWAWMFTDPTKNQYSCAMFAKLTRKKSLHHSVCYRPFVASVLWELLIKEALSVLILCKPNNHRMPLLYHMKMAGF